MLSNGSSWQNRSNRQGVIMSHPPKPMGPLAIDVSSLSWDSFDHSRTLRLGLSGSTSIVFQPASCGVFVLRFCNEDDFTPARKILMRMSASIDGLISAPCHFFYDRKCYIGSELSDMSLSDIIECTLPLQELHLSTILSQV